mmetsp:Transcript_55315/g.108258  ORF Transcript_55315/g.108258 Transcript_55315/m.108258 type:complete len:81 (+) Transcript_55315:3140-3382(+)
MHDSLSAYHLSASLFLALLVHLASKTVDVDQRSCHKLAGDVSFSSSSFFYRADAHGTAKKLMVLCISSLPPILFLFSFSL